MLRTQGYTGGNSTFLSGNSLLSLCYSVRKLLKTGEYSHPRMSKLAYNPVGRINRRSPPVSILGTETRE